MALEVPCLPVYRKCCYYFSLRRGSIVIGWIFMILHLFMIGGVCVRIQKLPLEKEKKLQNLAEVNDFHEQFRSRGMEAALGEVDFNMQMETKNLHTLYNFLTLIAVLVLIFCLVELALCGLMVFGIYKERPRYMVAELTAGVLGLVPLLFGLVYYLIVCLYGMLLFLHNDKTPPALQDKAIDKPFVEEFLISVGLIAANALVLYLWNEVYSYYRYLQVGRHESHGKVTETTA